jgi:predicted transcriptional regulator
MRQRGVDRALKLLGPLEGRVMRDVWAGRVPARFVVWDVGQRMPQLAYTTVMTTVARLASKGLLRAERVPRQRSVVYSAACTPDEYVRRVSEEQVDHLVGLLGEAALAAFEQRLDRLSPEHRRRLRELADR